MRKSKLQEYHTSRDNNGIWNTPNCEPTPLGLLWTTLDPAGHHSPVQMHFDGISAHILDDVSKWFHRDVKKHM